MENVNQYIEEFLDYYCGLPHPPEYAVLLKGPWGSGKSWFINQYSKKMKDQGQKVIYVSLYGVGSFSEIENIFFQQLHPVLSSKGMALTGKILKGALRATLKIDLDGDKRDDVSVNSHLPDISIPDYLKNTDGFLLIFDDLERCCINVDDVLGYINHFVEHQGYKSIIVANEDEITKREKNNHEFEVSYTRIKEKLIGKTFKIEPDIEAALDDFFAKLSDENAHTFLAKNRCIIKQLYDVSQYENLRHLKQALWDFERLFIRLPEKALAKENLLQHLLKLLFVFSFEIKSGAISALDIKKISKEYMSRLFKNSDEKSQESPIQLMLNKYGNVLALNDLLLEANIWESIFDKGKIDKQLIEESLLKSSYFKDDNAPEWVRLWHFLHLSDEEFEKVLAIVEKQFFDKDYFEVGVILHIYGILLWLSGNNLYDKAITDITHFAKEYIDTLREEGKLSGKVKSYISFLEREQWGGLGFFGKDTDEFKSVFQYFQEAMGKAELDKMPEAAKKVLDAMREDTNKFYRMVTLSNTEDQIYHEAPVFAYISPKEFVEVFLSLNPDDKYTVAYAIERRYEIPHINSKLVIDYKSLKEIRSILADKQKDLISKVSGHVIKSLIENHIDKALDCLSKVYPQPEYNQQTAGAEIVSLPVQP